uniref:Enhancer of mRNA-decapping protein 4 C-terminal domain-containing protein n=1 Tax=Megaselia scalaris TaxID=36166 RepID=T1GP41_MEGSC
MFHQLKEAFVLGIKDFMDQFDGYLTKLQPVKESTDEILTKVNSFNELFEKVYHKQKLLTRESILESRKDLKAVEMSVVNQLSSIMKTEIRKNLEDQATSLENSMLNVVRSQAQTPAPSIYDVQEQIKALLHQGHINKAFHQALIANDLALVEFTLDKADYKEVFNPCCLEQTVLLSLIQQISADMNNHNDIKQKYLSDSILNLDLTDSITREHAPKVLTELYKNCQSYLKLLPKSTLFNNVRMIMMAIQGMGVMI